MVDYTPFPYATKMQQWAYNGGRPIVGWWVDVHDLSFPDTAFSQGYYNTVILQTGFVTMGASDQWTAFPPAPARVMEVCCQAARARA